MLNYQSFHFLSAQNAAQTLLLKIIKHYHKTLLMQIAYSYSAPTFIRTSFKGKSVLKLTGHPQRLGL